MIYVKGALSGLLAVAIGGMIPLAVFLRNPYIGSFDGRDILLFGILPVLIVFSGGFWWMFSRESKRLSK
jgi:hypothetical protein